MVRDTSYWSKTRNDIVPGVAKHRIDTLQPEHFERITERCSMRGALPPTW
ncbi:hypothetical protein [Streptomyces sp. PmtA]